MLGDITSRIVTYRTEVSLCTNTEFLIPALNSGSRANVSYCFYFLR